MSNQIIQIYLYNLIINEKKIINNNFENYRKIINWLYICYYITNNKILLGQNLKINIIKYTK